MGGLENIADTIWQTFIEKLLWLLCSSWLCGASWSQGTSLPPGPGGGGEEGLGSRHAVFHTRASWMGTDGMWDTRASEQSGIDFRILGLNNRQNERHLLRRERLLEEHMSEEIRKPSFQSVTFAMANEHRRAGAELKMERVSVRFGTEMRATRRDCDSRASTLWEALRLDKSTYVRKSGGLSLRVPQYLRFGKWRLSSKRVKSSEVRGLRKRSKKKVFPERRKDGQCQCIYTRRMATGAETAGYSRRR